MSYIIDKIFFTLDYDGQYQKNEDNSSELNLSLNTNILNRKNKILHIFEQIFQNIDAKYQVLNSSQSIIKIEIIIYNIIQRFFDIVIKLQFDLDLQCLILWVILIKDQIIFTIQTIEQRIMGSKIFSKNNLNLINKLVISLQNGQLKILRPPLFSQQNRFQDVLNTKRSSQYLLNIFKSVVNDGVIILKSFLSFLKSQYSQQQKTIQRRKCENSLLKNIFRYTIRSPIEPAFDVSFGSGKYDAMQQLTKNQIYNVNHMFQNIVTEFDQFQTYKLYLIPSNQFQNLKKLYKRQYFSFTDEQLNNLKQKALPPINRMNINSQLKHIYNLIDINDDFPFNLKKIKLGGFSQINIAEVQFKIVYNSSNKRQQQLKKAQDHYQQHNLLPVIPQLIEQKIYKRRPLVFKNNNSLCIQTNRNRVLHELKIISQFQGVSSIFLPKYYKINNNKSPYAQYLIMQYLPYPTLAQYLQGNKSSISLLTKIHFSSLIIQALRFIKTYDIVHLDLKPANIIVSKKMIIKLIDFGQSYSKKICQKIFKPAFSMPYGCPEVFEYFNIRQFNQKNDVYSWAIILFEILFKRVPYHFTLEKAIKIFKNKTYLKYIFYVPQQQQKYGSWQLIPLLRNVLFRALDPQVKNRPCTLWLTVVFKQFLNYLINFDTNIIHTYL